MSELRCYSMNDPITNTAALLSGIPVRFGEVVGDACYPEISPSLVVADARG